MGVLALSVTGNPAEVPSYARRHGFDGLVAYLIGDEGLDVIELSSIPATYFVNADGRVVGVAKGGRSRRFFARQAEALLDLAPELDGAPDEASDGAR